MNAITEYLAANYALIGSWLVPTIWLASLPLISSLALALPMAWCASRVPWIAVPLVPAARVLFTIPSIVLFLLLPGILGTRILDPVNVGVALTLYGMALLLPSALDGFQSVPSDAVVAARAIGLSAFQQLRQVELPNAVPVIGAGLRVAAASNVSLISVASIIGTAQLGQLFATGINLGELAPIVIGLVMFVALAALLDAAILGLMRWLTPWQRVAES